MHTVASIAETVVLGLSRAEEFVRQTEDPGEQALLAVELESIVSSANALITEAKPSALTLYYLDNPLAA